MTQGYKEKPVLGSLPNFFDIFVFCFFLLLVFCMDDTFFINKNTADREKKKKVRENRGPLHKLFLGLVFLYVIHIYKKKLKKKTKGKSRTPGCHGQGTSFCFCFLCSFILSRLVFHDRAIKKGFV